MIFCDYLTIYQIHHKTLPVVNSGHVFSVDSDGVVEWDCMQKLDVEGSFSTKIRVSCDGNRVFLSGNVGRFNRSDNVFGYSVLQCVAIANKILGLFGLPPFTDASNIPLNNSVRQNHFRRVGVDGLKRDLAPNDLDMGSDNDAGFILGGAVITRVDLTCNWSSGSPGNASQVIRHMQGFKSGRFEPRSYNCSGVSWGEGSKFWYAKVYDKAADYVRHYGVGTVLHDAKIYDFILCSGVVRHEITLKSRYLRQNGLSGLSRWVDGMEKKIYALFSDCLDGSFNSDTFLEIPGRAGELAVAWRDGADLKKRLSHNTFYRYRRQLLTYGIDIAVPSNVTRINTRVNVIDIGQTSLPFWYSLPSVDVIQFCPVAEGQNSAKKLRIA